MTEEDLSALVTSIDENDIEIISSNGADFTDQLHFMHDHFAPTSRQMEASLAPTISMINTTTGSSQHEDLEEFEDETFMERIYGLTEMFPDWLHRFAHKSYQYSKYAGAFMKKSIWFCSSSFLVLILPILVQMEFSQVADMQAAQTREILLGPSAQIGSQSVLGLK
ncbi:unnamed protein product [Adineta ricciae]|uniref:Mitochondrial import receptor subunit TOM22 homolog n=1 Tax=Adineta ricciae TaxID=249248 RepID=A0A814KA38_ADIRI|nr:unnamed protein product [Adineta ricciae]CAF1048320.1 unnamed protein product [Adineta ricciae]